MDDSSEVLEQPPPPTPSSSKDTDDFRIKCTNKESLNDIIKVICSHTSELAESSIDKEDFISLFNSTFKSALLENIVVDDRPLILDSKLTSFEADNEKQIIDNNAEYAELCSTIAKTVLKRKTYPPQYSRIMKQKMKHEFQNVKKAKVIDSSAPKIFPEASKKDNIKHFKEFCNEFQSIQESVKYKTEKRKELEMKISLASDVMKSQKASSKSK